MRYAHDCPRDWRELAPYLSVDDAAAFRAFALSEGIILETADPQLVEDAYTEWCLRPTTAPLQSTH